MPSNCFPRGNLGQGDIQPLAVTYGTPQGLHSLQLCFSCVFRIRRHSAQFGTIAAEHGSASRQTKVDSTCCKSVCDSGTCAIEDNPCLDRLSSASAVCLTHLALPIPWVDLRADGAVINRLDWPIVVPNWPEIVLSGQSCSKHASALLPGL